MKEEYLQFIWQHLLFKQGQLRTVSGKPLEVLQTGELNRDSGPDFFNARIRIGGITLAGNVEVHVHSSDWLRHGHQNDRAYNTLILHVVFRHDAQLEQNTTHNVEVLELKDRVSEELIRRCKGLLASKAALPCASQLADCPTQIFDEVLSLRLEERLEQKSRQIAGQWVYLGNHYTQTYYSLLLRHFGFNLNAQAFELLARALPLTILLRHANDLMQLEALLLGTAGLLEQKLDEDYPLQLRKEFAFLSAKYGIKPLESSLLRYSRTRPNNFPDLRLAQFAALIHQSPEMLQAPQAYTEYKVLLERFQLRAGPYWQQHYRLQRPSVKPTGQIGSASAELLIINCLVPFLIYYAQAQHQPNYREKALALLNACSFENNRKTRLFHSRTAPFRSAAHSQGCLQLYDSWCRKKKCLQCNVAAALLKPKALS